jgi:hypothetical protein
MARPCFGPCDPSLLDYAAYIGVVLVAVAAVGIAYVLARRVATAVGLHGPVPSVISIAVAVLLAVAVLPRYPRPTFIPSSLTAGLPGSGRTDAFYLQGSYSVTWSDARLSPLTCPVDAALIRDEDGVQVARLTAADVQQRAAQTDQPDTLTGLSGGAYYLDAVSSCEWRVTLTPAAT